MSKLKYVFLSSFLATHIYGGPMEDYVGTAIQAVKLFLSHDTEVKSYIAKLESDNDKLYAAAKKMHQSQTAQSQPVPQATQTNLPEVSDKPNFDNVSESKSEENNIS